MIQMKDIDKAFALREPSSILRHKNFSVLVPFVEKDGKLYIALEERNHQMKSDPGEICFPGGHIEPGEDPKDAAFRETFEEIGVPQNRIRYIAQGNTLHGFANYTMYTYIGEIDYEDFQKCKIEESEVAEVFLVSVEDLARAEKTEYDFEVSPDYDKKYFPYEEVGITREYNWRKGRWKVPVFERINGKCIWGLTALILIDILHILEEEALI